MLLPDRSIRDDIAEVRNYVLVVNLQHIVDKISVYAQVEPSTHRGQLVVRYFSDVCDTLFCENQV
jgi:hypothetical protein